MDNFLFTQKKDTVTYLLSVVVVYKDSINYRCFLCLHRQLYLNLAWSPVKAQTTKGSNLFTDNGGQQS